MGIFPLNSTIVLLWSTLFCAINGQDTDTPPESIVCPISDPSSCPICIPSSPIVSSARDILAILFVTTNGLKWDNSENWGSANECDYFGVACDNGVVVEINLRSNGLTGSIPSQLDQLISLKNLHLDFNSLTGSIPCQLGQLSGLESIFLGGNGLTGSIPCQLDQSSSLERVLIGRNQLTGTIPSQLGQLSSLRRLSLIDNSLTGTVPCQLGQLSSLDTLVFSHNQLIGTIPSQLGQLSRLKRFDLRSNGLTGSIPSQFGQLTRLGEFRLGNNALTGSIPNEVCEMEISTTDITCLEALTSSPTKAPTSSPTKAPTSSPTKAPTSSPIKAPTSSPTEAPTSSPTKAPTLSPTKAPSSSPTKAPTSSPTKAPTLSPTKAPTSSTTKAPTSSSEVFNIQLINMGSNTNFDVFFQSAKERWEEIIVGDLSPFPANEVPDWFGGLFGPGNGFNGAVDDIVIGYALASIDGPGGILGQAGPTFIRPGTFTPIAGIMFFDVDDFLSRSDEDVEIIIRHEMGHVFGLVASIKTECGCSSPPNPFGYKCLFAQEEYAQIVPGQTLRLENDGGPGSFCSHWEEDNFAQNTGSSELMTATFVSGVAQPLSRVTVGALNDQGYVVNYDMADSPFVQSTVDAQRTTKDEQGKVLTCTTDFTLADKMIVPEVRYMEDLN